MSSWREFLTVRGVIIAPPALRRCSEPGDIEYCERKIGAALPESYRRFCREIGAGSLGDVDFIAPGPLRKGSLRRSDRLVNHVRLTQRALQALDTDLDPRDVLSFASTSDGDWFFWLRSEMGADDAPIYLASADLDEPQACAEGLAEFIDHVCLGERLVELGLYETQGPAPLREFLPIR